MPRKKWVQDPDQPRRWTRNKNEEWWGPAALVPMLQPIVDLWQLPGNPRRGDVEAVAKSYKTFGQRRPVVTRKDSDGNPVIQAGNHQRMAVEKLEWSHMAVVDADDMTAEESAAFALADNRTSQLGTYDTEMLGAALADVIEYSPELIESTGFTIEESMEIIDIDDTSSDTMEPEGAINFDAPTRSSLGDVWEIGPHRIMIGDASDIDHVRLLTDGRDVNMAFTSPPYADRRKYDPTSGFVPIHPDQYVDWFSPIAANVSDVMAGDASWFVNIKPSCEGLDSDLYVMDLVLAHARLWGWHWVTEFCWERIGMPKSVGRRFKNQFEPIYHFSRGEFKMRPDNVRHQSDNVPVAGGPGVGATTWADNQGGNGQMFGAKKHINGTSSTMSDVQGQNVAPGEYIKKGMAYPGNRLPTFSGSHKSTGHSAAFPVGLPEFFVMAYTDEGDAVYDPFVGSGSTVVAAAAHGRIGMGMEISPTYADISIERVAQYIDETPKKVHP